MKKKSIIVITLCTAMALSLAACGSTHTGEQEVSSTSESNTVTIANSFEEFDNLNDAMDFAGFDISTPDSVGELNRSVIRASKEDKFMVTKSTTSIFAKVTAVVTSAETIMSLQKKMPLTLTVWLLQ